MKFSGPFRAFVLLTLLIQALSISFVGPVIPTLMERIAGANTAGAVSTLYGWSLAVGSITMFISAPIMGRLADRFGRRPIVMLSLAGGVFDAVVTATTTHVWVFLVMRAIAGVLGAGGAAVQAAIADITPPEERARHSRPSAPLSARVSLSVPPSVGSSANGAAPVRPFGPWRRSMS